MGIFKGRTRRKRTGADRRREARWKNTQAIVHELFPVDRFPPLPAESPAHQDAPTMRILRSEPPRLFEPRLPLRPPSQGY